MTSDDASTPWDGPAGWSFEWWGRRGRPVLFINDRSVDRSTWWPVAAQLADEYRVAVVQPPAHESPLSLDALDALVEQLAHSIARVVSMAPVVVGHSSAAVLASLFGARFVAHAVVNIEQPLHCGSERCTSSGQAPADTATDVGPSRCPGTGECAPVRPQDDTRTALIAALCSIRVPYLSVFGSSPWPGYSAWLKSVVPTSQVVAYGTPGRIPHLADQVRFIADIRRLAG